MSALTAEDRINRLRLARSENVGPVTYHRLLSRYGTAAAALQALPALAARGGRKQPVRILPAAQAEREIAALKRFGASLLFHGEPEFPEFLAAIDPAPPLITVAGHRHLLARPAVAIVGARNASAGGLRIARDIAAGLGEAGYTIVSGLARGIDAAAHRASLDTGTIGVLGGGIDVIYPEQNAELYTDMKAHGALLSEMPLGTQPKAKHFPRRNRLISGLTLGVVVIEAALRSGSLITARYALEQGRDVFAVPGSPLDPRAKGANRLIRDGAPLTESAEDVIDALAGVNRPVAEPESDRYAPAPHTGTAEPDHTDRARIIEALSPTLTGIDDIVRETGIAIPTVMTVLLELQLAGRLQQEVGNRVALLDAAAQEADMDTLI